MKISSGSLLLVTALLLLPVRVYEQASFRTITIDTSEVTTPAVARWQSHRVRLEPRRERVEHLRAGSCEQARHADLTRGRSGQTGMES